MAWACVLPAAAGAQPVTLRLSFFASDQAIKPWLDAVNADPSPGGEDRGLSEWHAGKVAENRESPAVNKHQGTANSGLPSPRISEIVLRTSNFDVMRSWYQTVLSAEPSFEYDVPGGGPQGNTKVLNFHRVCFLRVFSEFPYTQVLALFELPNLKKPDGTSGLHHMQFRHASLKEWAARYEHLKKAGITPYQSFNHGPSMSCYYEDPDGNLAEISGPNYLTDAEYRDFFASPGFARNPAGVEIDVEKFLARLRAGEDRRQLVQLPS